MLIKLKNKLPANGGSSLPGNGGDIWKMAGRRLRLRLCLQHALYKTGEFLGAWLRLVQEIFSK
jgi:hypothetical protein